MEEIETCEECGAELEYDCCEECDGGGHCPVCDRGEVARPATVICPNCGFDEVYPILVVWHEKGVMCSRCEIIFDMDTGKRLLPPKEHEPSIMERGKEFFYMTAGEWLSMLARYSRSIQREMIQSHINHIRVRVMIHTVRNHIKKEYKKYKDDATTWHNQLTKPEVQHLWFAEKDLQHREIRNGNPSPDSQRPWWLQGAELQIDVTQMPREVWERLLPGGDLDQMIADEMEYQNKLHQHTADKPYIWTPDKEIIQVH